MRTTYEIENEIDEIVDELDEISRMTEDEVAAKFNVDSKAQIIERDNEILVELTKELGEAFDGEAATRQKRSSVATWRWKNTCINCIVSITDD